MKFTDHRNSNFTDQILLAIHAHALGSGGQPTWKPL